MRPVSSANSEVSPSFLSRAQRAHYRLSWAERLVRNAQALTAGRVTIRLFGVPEHFATSLGLASACTPLRRFRCFLSSDRRATPLGAAYPLCLAFPLFLSRPAFFAPWPTVSAAPQKRNVQLFVRLRPWIQRLALQ